MIATYFLMEPKYWIIPWLLQSFAYSFILRKMGLKVRYCLIPFVAEHEFTKKLFRRTRTFWRPFIIAAVFVVGGYYLGPTEGMGRVYMLIAFIVYGIFLLRLYYRMSRSFGKGRLFSMIMIFFPTVFLLIIGLGRCQFTAPEFREERKHSKFFNDLRNVTVFIISAIEVIVLVVSVGFFTIRTYMPRPMANWMLDDVYAKSKDIVSDGSAVSRETAMGEGAAAKIAGIKRNRNYFYPDHSGDKSVVVLEYIIGSNLEDSAGMASANIRMMEEATKRGDALTFVIEAGGSGRWFTNGIDENAVGRYAIRGGAVEKALELDPLTCMSEPESLSDFISWSVKEYPADRYMLVLWDHGGGVPYGFGQDALNDREDDDNDTMRVSEIADAIGKSGAKFDVIGFDACLMQELEIAYELEPYADYFLASEETEGGYGWYYTDGFGRLAEDPGLSSDEFGKAMVSTYDQFNRALHNGEPQSDATLSFVDMTLVPNVAAGVVGVFDKIDEAIKKDPADYTELGLAASNTYAFNDDMQIDLIDFFDKLNDADINDSICPSQERQDASDALRACVMYRNADAPNGAKGLAFAFPYKAIEYYSDTYDELDRLSLRDETGMFDDVFSIMAVEKQKEADAQMSDSDNIFVRAYKELMRPDYTNEAWYVKGFEDYDTAKYFVDIPLKELAEGYQPQLPDKTWNIIVDCQTLLYQKDEEGRWRCLGSDEIGGTDEKGHPLIGVSDTWVNINGHVVSYTAQPVRETDGGDVFVGTVNALLNGTDEIIMQIEWDPVKDGAEALTGRVTGYEYADDELSFSQKGKSQLKAGDSVEFLFDYYNEEGRKVATEPYGGSILFTKDTNLTVEEKPLEDGDYAFCGILTDAYQREMTTEVVEAHIGE